MLRILTFLACITLAMAASVSREAIINAGGMLTFSKKGIFENNSIESVGPDVVD
jgi:hypothetical protein